MIEHAKFKMLRRNRGYIECSWDMTVFCVNCGYEIDYGAEIAQDDAKIPKSLKVGVADYGGCCTNDWWADGPVRD